MSVVLVDNKDEIIMRLVHYFITEENYTPIIVRGVKDEIWLENDSAPYKIVRINSNYIHNEEQYKFDVYKTKNIMKQIKRKTLSFSLKTLNIHLNLNDNLKPNNVKDVDAINLKLSEDIGTHKGLLSIFPNIKDKLIKDTNGLDLILNVTKDINEKTERENNAYAKTFGPKKIIITPILIIACIVLYLFSTKGALFQADSSLLTQMGSVIGSKIRAGEIWRLITGTFLHLDFSHLIINMYTLYILGPQVETYFGKAKYLFIYLISGICGSLMSITFNTGNVQSVGASGALFGLLGCILYFGYHHRLYLGSVLTRQIVPVIAINLLIGFIFTGIDNAAHIGGLLGGFFATMALGVENKDKKSDRINGWIVLILYIIFLVYAGFILTA